MRRALFALIVTLALPARADSIWEKAKAPPQTKAELTNDQQHNIVAAVLHRNRKKSILDPLHGAEVIAEVSGALNVLERHNASASADPRIRYDLGFALAKLRRFKEATVAFEGALKLAKDHPFAQDGAFELALAYSLLGKHADEERAYLVALEVTDRISHKAVIYSNLAESRMAQGKLEPAIEAAELSIELEADFASARYNLAILKDRSGDPSGALEAAKHALEQDPEAEYLDGDGVFFEPAYEKQWYYALRYLALADRSTGDERTNHLLAALVSYRKWLDAADAADRYRPRCVDAITRLEKMLKLKPPKP